MFHRVHHPHLHVLPNSQLHCPHTIIGQLHHPSYYVFACSLTTGLVIGDLTPELEDSAPLLVRRQYLRKMVKIGFIHFTNAPTESAIPTDIDPPTLEKRSKTVVLFHNESTYNAIMMIKI